MRSVGAQLRAFRREMEADGAAQRAECRRLVATAVRRAQELVDSVLQVTATLTKLSGCSRSCCSSTPHIQILQ